jgi:hypothetical protein
MINKMFRYKPWKGFLLWLGNIPIVIVLVHYELVRRDVFLYIHALCFGLALFWSTFYDEGD